MPYVYLDESESQAAEKYFVGALIANASKTKKLVSALNELGVDIAARFDVEERAEFHGYAIANGKDDWLSLAGKTRARLAVLREVIETIAQHDVEYLVRGVAVDELKQRYSNPDSPHKVCFEHIVQRLEKDLRGEGRLAMMIADEHHLASSLRSQLRKWETEGTRASYLHTKPTQLLDTIHFTPSIESRMLQAVDVLTYFYQRRICVEPSSNAEKKYMDEVWDVFSQVLHPGWGVWAPLNGRR